MNQIIDGESREIVVREPTALAVERAPDAVLEEASRAATALKSVLDQKPNKVMMGGEQYLEFEDWQTLGRFYGVTAREDGDAEYVEFGGVYGFRASAVALTREGQIVSRATAFCLSDEPKWSTRAEYAWGYVCKDGSWSVEDPGKDQIIWEDNPQQAGKKRPKKERRSIGNVSVPLFQLSSMAQTRACAKALRNVLSWVAVLAGYRPTPAEEMDGVGTERQATPATEAIPTATPPRAATPAKAAVTESVKSAPGAPSGKPVTDDQRSALKSMMERLGREVPLPEQFEDAARLISTLNEEINTPKGDFIEGEAREIPADAGAEAIPFNGDPSPIKGKPQATDAGSPDGLVCASCGEPLIETRFRDGTVWSPAQLAAYGRRKHGRVLCMREYREANDALRLSQATESVPF